MSAGSNIIFFATSKLARFLINPNLNTNKRTAESTGT